VNITKKEIARDLMGLGSIPFLVLVVVRITMAGNFLELFHIVVATAFVSLTSVFVRAVHFHSAIIVILIIFTSVFYEDRYYTVFAILTGVLAVYGFIAYLKLEYVYRSVLIGLLASLAAWLLSLRFDIPNI